ncbi:unnamed protein product [Hymenolepis diminuta]|uniref:DUF5736 domain-containing protein n=1 Tax=Hymenolepis diminuta TaxID=6216 RepID=A0A0R3SPM6_HYMDI|nr:unnamed protein product [Hymenolepis diminuta]
MLVSGHREPAYQGISEDESAGFPQRRPTGRNLRDRITNIVSMYVPNGQNMDNSQLKYDLVDDGDATQMNDHFGLLSLGEMENKVDSGKPELCHITPQIDRNSLFTSVIDEIQDSNYRVDLMDFAISCLATNGTHLYFGVESLPFLFKLDTVDLHSGKCSVTKNHLKTAQNIDLIPTKICLNGAASEIYVIGTTLFEGLDMHLLACFSNDGHLIAQTKKYPYKRYLAIDVDFDGNLLLGCISQSIEGSNVKGSSQICKLTPHFERRIFSITMRKAETSYCPDGLAKSCVRDQCWASVSRWDDETKRTVRRIFAFPSAPPDTDQLHQEDESNLSPKKWLQVISWNFESFSAGPVFALDSQRLLTLDVEQKSLALITWPEGQDSASLQRITKPGNRKIDHFCAAHVYPPVAYFSSDGDIFKFVPAALEVSTLTTLSS